MSTQRRSVHITDRVELAAELARVRRDAALRLDGAYEGTVGWSMDCSPEVIDALFSGHFVLPDGSKARLSGIYLDYLSVNFAKVTPSFETFE